MRIKILLTIICIGVTLHGFSQSGCLDPNPQSITTICGTTVDICLDNYVLEPGQQMIVMDVFLNDLELFDPCASEIITDPKKGKVFRVEDFPRTVDGVYYEKPDGFDDCLHVYIAATANGTLNDEYDYQIIINEECPTIPDYCQSGSEANGKIWTIYSKYVGPNVDSLEVYNKKGQSSTIFATYNTALSNGDYFFIDGTELPNNQTEWVYKFFLSNNGGTKDVQIHTSCSEFIFGVTYPSLNDPMIIPMSGCVSPSNGGQTPGPSEPCNLTPPNLSNTRDFIDTREEVIYSTQSSDITTVTILRETILPLRLSEFSVFDQDEANVVQWTVESAKDEFEMILEKSNDGVYFNPIKAFANITLQTYTFYDKDISHKDHYYRIKSVSLNGDVSYSDIKYIEREVNSTIRMYPNPTNGVLEISLISNDIDNISQINLYDMAGRRVHTNNMNAIFKRLDLKSLGFSSGVYIMEAQSDNGLRKIERIIIQ